LAGIGIFFRFQKGGAKNHPYYGGEKRPNVAEYALVEEESQSRNGKWECANVYCFPKLIFLTPNQSGDGEEEKEDW
jgi:hypothetical protein